MHQTEHAKPTHAGAVVYRGSLTSPEFLLVGAKGNRSEWVLPKGHIEDAEDPSAAACREVFEEAGVVAEIVNNHELGCVSYSARGTAVQVVYFLARCVSDAHAPEDRGKAWVPMDHAETTVTHEEARRILRRARMQLATMARTN